LAIAQAIAFLDPIFSIYPHHRTEQIQKYIKTPAVCCCCHKQLQYDHWKEYISGSGLIASSIPSASSSSSLPYTLPYLSEEYIPCNLAAITPNKNNTHTDE
jgi:hypothetical protein